MTDVANPEVQLLHGIDSGYVGLVHCVSWAGDQLST